MGKWKIIVLLAFIVTTVVVAQDFQYELYDESERIVIKDVVTTGYWPPPPEGYKTEEEAKREGGGFDRRGIPLRTLQGYYLGSYVSAAVDPKVIALGKIFTIDGYERNGYSIIFLACDVGSGISGNEIDICVTGSMEARKVTNRYANKKATVTIIGYELINNRNARIRAARITLAEIKTEIKETAGEAKTKGVDVSVLQDRLNSFKNRLAAEIKKMQEKK